MTTCYIICLNGDRLIKAEIPNYGTVQIITGGGIQLTVSVSLLVRFLHNSTQMVHRPAHHK
jgi:hypothetical protein